MNLDFAQTEVSMKCDAITMLSGPLDEESDHCGRHAVQFILFTEDALRDGWLHTGDSSYLDEEGFLFSRSKLYCRCKDHQIETQFKDVRLLTEEEAAVLTTMEE